MKKIEAIVRHHKLDDVKQTVAEQGVSGMTVTEVRGFGRQRGRSEIYRGAEYRVDFIPKYKIEIVVPDAKLDAVVEAILRSGKTGQVGDGKIFISELSNAIRIRTGESGDDVV